ncbi:MAG: TonB-dependent receptor [Planctomycetales bacterium]|nr:TonB-dependent receptor [Planctomycetales bacterium]
MPRQPAVDSNSGGATTPGDSSPNRSTPFPDNLDFPDDGFARDPSNLSDPSNPANWGEDADRPGPSGESLLDFGIQLDGGLRSSRSLFDDPTHRSVIDLQQITERAPVDMFDAIQREVGVLVQRTQRGAAAPFIRGLTGQQVLIMVDGIRLNNATFRAGPNQYFNTIDPGMVQRIEVLRGPQTVLYGSDAIGGAINIVTRSASNRFTSYGGQASWVNRYSSADNGFYTRANYEGSTQDVAVFGGGGYGNFNDLDRGGDLGRQPWTSYSHWAGDGKIEYLLDERSMLTVAFQHFVQEDVARSDRFPSRLTIFDPQQRTLAYVRYQGIDFDEWFDRVMFTASYHRQKEGVFDQRLNSTNQDLSEVDNHSFGLNLLMSSDLGPAGRLTYGVDMNYDSVDSVKDRYNATTGLFVEPRTPTYPDDGVYAQTGVYGQWEVDLTPRLSGQAGVRYTHVYAAATPVIGVDDDNDPNTAPVDTPIRISPDFDNWSASSGLTYELLPGLQLAASVAEGFRAPNLDDLAATNENVQQNAADTPSVNLRPEKSISYDVGFKTESRLMRGQVYYFWTDIEDMILRTTAAGGAGTTLFSRTNRDARVNGFELGGAVEAGGNWELYGNLSYYLGDDIVNNEPLSRIPPTQGVLGTRWRDPCGNYADFYAWMSGRQDRLNSQDLTDSRIPNTGTPGFATFNLRLGKQINEWQRVSLNLENLLDKAYRVHGSGVDGPGFSAIVSYEITR